ncbi:MAG: hypothetical protein K6F57_00830 [Candidatus Saccharibacteria bacterium]|nr:hypothetical protein [Candidatus Saccharibacteria bacterium]
MSKLDSIKMTIPVEMDGKVNDEKAFQRQQQINEARLKREIEDSYESDQDGQSYDSLDYEDYGGSEYVPNPYSNLEAKSDEEKAIIAQRTQDLLTKLKAKEVFSDVA